jgi:hypothetical protein
VSMRPWIFRPQAQLMLNDRKFRERLTKMLLNISSSL